MNCASSGLRLVIASRTIARDSKAREHSDCSTSQEETQEQKAVPLPQGTLALCH